MKSTLSSDRVLFRAAESVGPYVYATKTKAPLLKGGWQKSMIFDWGIGCKKAIPPPGVFTGYLPLHKGGFL